MPTKTDFVTLYNDVGGAGIAGTKLKSISGWHDVGNGTDAYSFSALPAGHRGAEYEGFGGEGFRAYFWSSTEYNSKIAFVMILSYDDGSVCLTGYDGAYAGLGYDFKDYAFSVRCVKD